MSEDFSRLYSELLAIDEKMLAAEQEFENVLSGVHYSNSRNAINLLHYLVLRSLDIREMQDTLHTHGLSSMASSESHVRGQLKAILQRIDPAYNNSSEVYNYHTGTLSLKGKAKAIFGEKTESNCPSIMVTFDSSLADDYAKVKNLLQSGMNIARINCAHDDESSWFRMIQHLKRAVKVTGITCKVYMDLAGPKIRTVISKHGKVHIEEGAFIYLTEEDKIKDEKTDIGCTIPGIAEQLNPGEVVLFDDGMIETRIDKIEHNRVKLQVVRISSKKPHIKHGKGINFPDSSLQIPALTAFDINCLSFINKYADIVGYSFVRTPKDLLELYDVIGNNSKLALVIKIETPEAVKNLPELLFCGLQREHTGIMIARGDLAVEIGFERMSEIQEEILWICEAAHVPVIWATQVLDNLNKSGLATRSEITDAAYAAMADCVMINKGTHIIRTLEMLRDILLRSGGHHIKKRFTFRPLRIASRFMTQ